MKKPMNLANSRGQVIAAVYPKTKEVRVTFSRLEGKAIRQLARRLYEFARYLESKKEKAT